MGVEPKDDLTLLTQELQALAPEQYEFDLGDDMLVIKEASPIASSKPRSWTVGVVDHEKFGPSYYGYAGESGPPSNRNRWIWGAGDAERAAIVFRRLVREMRFEDDAELAPARHTP